MKKTLLVLGGDRRMEYAAERLGADYYVYTYGFSGSKPIWELKQADVLVLPYLSLSGEFLKARDTLPLFRRRFPPSLPSTS